MDVGSIALGLWWMLAVALALGLVDVGSSTRSLVDVGSSTSTRSPILTFISRAFQSYHSFCLFCDFFMLCMTISLAASILSLTLVT